MDTAALLDAPLGDLMAEAARLRDAAHGARVTYSPKVFIPLTMLCRDRCGYCTFAKAPAHLVAPYLTIDEVLAIARRGAAFGCHEALFTLGEAPEARYPVARAWLDEHGHASTVDYLVAMARLVLDETGLLPHANAGALDAGAFHPAEPTRPLQQVMVPGRGRFDLDHVHDPAELVDRRRGVGVGVGVHTDDNDAIWWCHGDALLA